MIPKASNKPIPSSKKGGLRGRLIATAFGLGCLSPGSSIAADFYNETLQDGTEAILIMGEIEKGDEEKFRELSIQFPNAVVGLDSEGGQLVPALEIGRLIRLRSYETMVLQGDTCASSCALIWMGGSRRTLQKGARLGFHASYYDDQGKRVESGAANALIGRYLTQLNFSEDAVLFATLASPNEVWWLDETTRDFAGIDYVLHESKPEAVPSLPPKITTNIPAPAPSAPVGIRALLRSDGAAERGASALGATGGLHAALSDHLSQIYANDAVMHKVEGEMAAARIDFRANPQLGGVLLFRLSTKLMTSGLSRLPQGDVNRFFSYLSVVVAAEGPTCEVSLATDAKVNLKEFRIVEGLGGNHLADYLGLLRKAIFAEASQSPPRIVLDQAQIALAEAAFAEVLLERMTATGWSEEQFTVAVDAFENPTEANRANRCAATKLMVPVVAEMDGMAGDWNRRVYLTYIQDSI